MAEQCIVPEVNRRLAMLIKVGYAGRIERACKRLQVPAAHLSRSLFTLNSFMHECGDEAESVARSVQRDHLCAACIYCSRLISDSSNAPSKCSITQRLLAENSEHDAWIYRVVQACSGDDGRQVHSSAQQKEIALQVRQLVRRILVTSGLAEALESATVPSLAYDNVTRLIDQLNCDNVACRMALIDGCTSLLNTLYKTQACVLHETEHCALAVVLIFIASVRSQQQCVKDEESRSHDDLLIARVNRRCADALSCEANRLLADLHSIAAHLAMYTQLPDS